MQNWIGWRESTLNGERPHVGHRAALEQCDAALRAVSCPSAFILSRILVKTPLYLIS